MAGSNQNTRRSFISKLAKGIAGASLAPSMVTSAHSQENIYELSRVDEKYGPNDMVQIAVIGAGGMG